jgi:hypothetical protein
MMMKSRILFLLAILLLLAGAVFAYLRFNKTEPAPSAITSENQEVVADELPNQKLQASYRFIATESGQLAIDLLRAHAEIETETYGDAGEFVTAINGLQGNNEYYWAFYLNNKYAEQGAAQTVLQQGDVIRFVYDAVRLTPSEANFPEDEGGVMIDLQEGAPDDTPTE